MASTSGFNQRPAAFKSEGGRFVNNSTYAPSLGSTTATPWVPSVPGVAESSHHNGAHGRPLTPGNRPSSFPMSSTMRATPNNGLGGGSSQKYTRSTNAEAPTRPRPLPNPQGDSSTSDRIVVSVTQDRVNDVKIDITSQAGDAQAIRKEIAFKLTNNPHLKFNIFRIVPPEFAATASLGDNELLATCLSLGDDQGTLRLFVDLVPSVAPSSSVQAISSAKESSSHAISSATTPVRFSMPEPSLSYVGDELLGGGSNSGHLGDSPARHVAHPDRSRYNYQDPMTNLDGNLTMPEPMYTPEQSEPGVSRFSVPYYEEIPVAMTYTPRTSISSLPSPSTPPPGESYIARDTLHSEPPEMTDAEILQRPAEHSADANARIGIECFQNPVAKAGQVPDGPRGTISRRMTTDEVLRELYLHGCKNITPYLNRAMSSDNPVAGGGFGDVYRGALNNGTEVGLKCVRLEVDLDNEGQKRVKEAAKELYIWSKCNHPNVLELIGVTQHHNRIAMVSPWMENGDLTRFLQTHPGTDRYHLCAQIADGVAYLHQEDVVHGDIKGANILVSNEHTPKITDFGTASRNDYTLKFTETSRSQTMSIRWTAPEIISEVTDRSTFKTDVFSLGMTILEVMTGMVPFHDTNQATVVLKLVTGAHPPRPEAHIPTGNERADLLWALLVDCWALKPEDRPTSIEVRDRMRSIASM